MNEWLNVKEVQFTNPDGDETLVKVRHTFRTETRTKVVDLQSRDIDHVAWKESGTELETLRYTELNAQKLMEYKFDLSKIKQIQVPI